jgi:predicted deacylase
VSPRPTRPPFILNKTEILPSTTQHLDVPISVLSTGTVLSVPVVVAHGNEPGKTLVVSAAIHGDEINGVDIVQKFLTHVRPRWLKGTVIAVPVVNVFGYLARSRYMPDRRDLNRSFPGSANGSLTGRIAHWFLKEIISKADVGVDIHTGSDNRVNVPQIRCNLEDPETARLATAFGAPILVQARLRANSLRAVASMRGLPMLVFEGGEALRFDPCVTDVGVRGLRRVLAAMDMMGSAEPLSEPVFVATGSAWARVKHGGLWYPEVVLGQDLVKGQVLGRVTDIYGHMRTKLVASWGGRVIGMTRMPHVSQGDAVVHIATNEGKLRSYEDE